MKSILSKYKLFIFEHLCFKPTCEEKKSKVDAKEKSAIEEIGPNLVSPHSLQLQMLYHIISYHFTLYLLYQQLQWSYAVWKAIMFGSLVSTPLHFLQLFQYTTKSGKRDGKERQKREEDYFCGLAMVPCFVSHLSSLLHFGLFFVNSSIIIMNHDI